MAQLVPRRARGEGIAGVTAQPAALASEARGLFDEPPGVLERLATAPCSETGKLWKDAKVIPF